MEHTFECGIKGSSNSSVGDIFLIGMIQAEQKAIEQRKKEKELKREVIVCSCGTKVSEVNWGSKLIPLAKTKPLTNEYVCKKCNKIIVKNNLEGIFYAE